VFSKTDRRPFRPALVYGALRALGIGAGAVAVGAFVGFLVNGAPQRPLAPLAAAGEVAAAPASTPPPIVEPREAAAPSAPADGLAMSLGNLEASVAYFNGNAIGDAQRRRAEGRITGAQSVDLKPPPVSPAPTGASAPRPSGDTMEAAAPAVEAASASTPPPIVEPQPQEAATPPAPASASLAFAEVRELQRRLRAVGFDPGPLDGNAGPTTANAARQYQRARGLAVTGEVDRDLLARLRGERTAARSPSPPRRQRNDVQDFFDGIDRLFRRL
jgi:hypothetical protein